MLVQHARLEGGVLTRRVGIKRAAQGLERSGDLVRRPARGPLEHHVLEQMGNPHLLSRLVQRGGTHPGPKRN